MNPGDFDTFDSTVYAPQFMKNTKQANSRLAKKEQTKLARQTFVFVAMSIVLLLAFIFIALPAVIRFAIDGDRVTDSGSIVDTIPPRVPVVSAPPPAVSEEKVVISGFGEPNSTIQSVVNREEGVSIEVSEDGSFEIEVPLNEGRNTISFYAINSANIESSLSREYSVTALLQNPTLEITSPEDGEVFETTSNQTITVTGQATSNSRVFLNERLLITNPEGEFRGSKRLDEGENELLFKVVDQANNETEKTITVEFRY